MKLNIGIFFGGSSRRREQSFYNARSIFTNLDRQLFEPVLIFADCHKQLYSPRWDLLYRESLCGLFPDPSALSDPDTPFPVYEESLGPLPEGPQSGLWGEYFRPITLEALPRHINLAIIAISAYPEAEIWVREALESVHIPYVGTGPAAHRFFRSFSSTQNFWADRGFDSLPFETISHAAWSHGDPIHYLDAAIHSLGLPLRIFPAEDPSNYALIDRKDDLSSFREAIDAAFHQERLPLQRWQEMNLFERVEHLRLLTDLHIGLGFPVRVQIGEFRSLAHHPAELLHLLNEYAGKPAFEQAECFLTSTLPKEDIVVLQAHPAGGKTFSVTVSPTRNGSVVFAPVGRMERYARGATPATEGTEWSESGFSASESAAIRDKAEAVVRQSGITQVLGITGSIAPDGKIFFEHVATGLSFLPEDPLFIAAGQAGKLPVDWLTWIIYHNLRDRVAECPAEISWRGLLEYLEENIAAKTPAPPVGVLCACPTGRQYLPESAGQIVQFLGAEGSFRPVPLLLENSPEGALFVRELPPVPLKREGGIQEIRSYPPFSPLPPLSLPAGRFSIDLLCEKVAAVFLDIQAEAAQGPLQKMLKACQIGFNGPVPAVAAVATHPFHSLEALRRNTQLNICEQFLLTRESFIAHPEAVMQRIESRFLYPLLGFPYNHGGIPLFRREELEALIRLAFRPEGTEGAAFRKILRLKPQQDIPARQELLFQEIVRPRGALHVLALQVPLVSKYDEEGNLVFQVFGPEERNGARLAAGTLHQEARRFGQLSEEIRHKVAEEVEKAAETAARILNIQGAAVVGLSVRVYENTHIEAVVEHLEMLPGWKLNGPLVRALLRQGQFPGKILAEIIRDTIAKPHLEQLALAARSEYISSNTPAIVNTPVLSEPNPQQGKNTTHTMENTPPTPQSNIRELRNRLPATGVVGIVQGWLLDLWYFVSSAIFLKNLAAAILFVFIFINFLSLGLKLYTHHGQAVEVQDYQGMTAREARRKARARSFTTLVNDSIYIVGKPAGVVLDQVPKPNSRIKKNRFIYLTVSSSTPPQVPLPSLVGGNDDFEQYRKKLGRLGINARVKDREFNAELEDNTILYLEFNGRRIEPGELKGGVKVPKGSTLEVVVSIRNTGTVDIPDLVCMTYEEAVFLLQSSQLTVGSVFAPGEPSPWLYVYKQTPGFNPALKLSVGEGISLYLSEEKPENCRE